MFKVGDIVEAWGIRGIVTCVNNGKNPFNVTVCIEHDDGAGSYFIFTSEGLYQGWHKEPSLKLISRPVKKVKKILYPAIVNTGDFHLISKYFQTAELYESLEHAKTRNGKVIGLGPAIEIEVDDET